MLCFYLFLLLILKVLDVEQLKHKISLYYNNLNLTGQLSEKYIRSHTTVSKNSEENVVIYIVELFTLYQIFPGL